MKRHNHLRYEHKRSEKEKEKRFVFTFGFSFLLGKWCLCWSHGQSNDISVYCICFYLDGSMHDEHKNRFYPLEENFLVFDSNFFVIEKHTSSSFRFHLISFEIRLVFNNFDETLWRTNSKSFSKNFDRFTIVNLARRSLENLISKRNKQTIGRR